MILKLVVTTGKFAGKEIPVRNNQFVIGRDSSCHLRPSSPAVSKLHCAVIVADEGVWIRDLKSTNGTFVNGQRVTDRAALNHGDKITVGPLILEVQLPPASTQTKSLPEKAAKPKENQEVKVTPPAKQPTKKKDPVGDDDVFEWLSEDDEVESTQADLSADFDFNQQTVLDAAPLTSETIPEITGDKPKPPVSANDGNTTSAADKALKGMGMSFRKRA